MSAPALAPWLLVFILALLPFPGSSTAIGAVGGLSLLNPENGIFSGETTTLSASVSAYVPIVTAMQARNISVLGYVPTGYFNHSPGCNQAGVCQTWTRIEAQIQAYYQNFPTLNGIFFDEVAPKVYACAAFGPEYSRLRTLAHTYAPSNSAGTIAFNTAVPDSCAVDAATRGEIVVLYEDTAAGYDPASNTALMTATAHARTSGVQSWHVVNTAPAWDVLVPMVKAYDPNWVYATNVGGD
ncbi:hypothetical protein HDU89_008387 [Geranomyces variabilis]|nr:hypothetical protein HDU89_008387 [Geranomyces variabilis]